MKTFVTSLLFAFAAIAPALAQKSIDAKEIIAKINRKEAVTYQNVTITGDLDLTNLANRREISEGNWGNQSREFLSVVEVPITFRNCSFTGKVLAYHTDEEEGKRLLSKNNTVYNANFTEAVTLENCQFTDNAAFKYSVFEQQARFSGNTFQREALFKYAKFQDAATFNGSAFKGYADFKYAKFDEASAFQGANFSKSADFKYTKFSEGVDFRQARFTGFTDFKYTKFPNGSTFDDTRFDGPTDFKYTTLAGRKFSPSSR
ncbi:pentapeptide repeat-containing protein [Spirosoma sp. KUDC1026]|uniref:pentapeptide repeat-containing protein n=1 Tax=Spirosoma sp. KUDC1026 TaxID=2745947 RepID=UPI00159BE953|nr:pentapeptide repeat-containing protein [Spirosoma sp. KUDC1026]QKZ12197.1 pentapeptide repeat-containing protein [Spirosoma sp. KUDC1026]